MGFTTIELVAVILLISILSVVILPRFSSGDGFSDYATRDQIIAAARLAQQRAMYDHSANSCYRVDISSGILSVQRFNGTGYDNIGPSADWLGGIDLGNTALSSRFYFDTLGSALDNTADCGGAAAQTTIAIPGSAGLGVCIHSTGYAQAQSC